MTWGKAKLGSVAKVISGFAFKSESFRTENGIPVIKIKNIQRENVDFNDTSYLPVDFLSVDPKFHVVKNDILISLTGSHITLPNSVVGRVAKYRFDFISLLNQRAGKITPKPNAAIDNEFLYQYLTLNDVRKEIALYGHGGANQCNISPSNVEDIEIPLPPLPIQQKIASILSAYDDLIENNLKRIRLLEEAAQHLYREWFVRFRFPGWEEVGFVDGLPEGWERKKLSDIYLTSSGGTPSRTNPEFYVGAVNWFKSKELMDCPLIESEEKISEIAVQKSSAKLFPVNTVLLAMYGATIGKLGILTIPATSNQACCGIISKDNDFNHLFLYQWLHSNKEHILSFRMGAAQENISQSVIRDLEIITPSRNTVQKFNHFSELTFLQIVNLTKQNQKLKEARDILLPRLMNQTIAV